MEEVVHFWTDGELPLAFLTVAAIVAACVAAAAGRTAIWIALVCSLIALVAGLIFDRETTLTLLADWHAMLADDAAPAVLGLIAVASGTAAAWGAIESINRSALDTAATAFLELRARYHSDTMASAVKQLADFAIPIKENVGDLWRRNLDADNFQALGKLLDAQRERLSPAQRDDLKRAVRQVAGYFDDVGFFLKHSILTRDTTKSFINLAGLNIYYEVCVPIYAIDNASAPSIAYARLLRSVMKQQGVGLVRRY